MVAAAALLAHAALGVSARAGSGTLAGPGGATTVAPMTRRSSSDSFRVKSYLLDFAGDHSLSAATVTEQPDQGRATYTVRLQLASGAQQSVVVAGPPGGLQIEMHDMTGDHVPNDVVLRPSVLSWLPTVLVNDGHDHFAVVVAGADPGSFSSPQNLGSRRQSVQSSAFLRSSGFKSIHLPASDRTLIPRFQQCPLSAFAPSFAWGAEHATSLGRAPPITT